MKVTRKIDANVKIMGAGLLDAAQAEALPTRLRIYNDWWWTCTAGDDENLVVVVYESGKVNHHGRNVDANFVFVRPMLVVSGVEVGDVFSFGGREFEVVQQGVAFCKGDIGLCCFNEECDKNMANMYALSDVENYINQWFVKEMNRTYKKVIVTGATLLSAEEAKSLPFRLAKYNSWWWLRSPGYSQDYAAYVNYDGSVCYCGNYVDNINDAVRPALVINLDFSTLKIGDCFNLGGKEFEIISDSLAFCKSDIGYHCFKKDFEAENANDYEASDVKKFVDEWFKGVASK